ncbi:hypothetical protein SAMN03159343_2682 [Klenkia marina]|uniref:Uncharacterized protein n=1 Tax=Klenkia marina TaxID=1960309 RepID=A0A1G4YFC2_9ACTN|nr:hypothetical protein SAMN03159343_2682 [Klenkia marina]
MGTYSSSHPAARARHAADCSASAKPVSDQCPYSSWRAARGARSCTGSSHHDRRAACTADPTVLCAQGGPSGGVGRSR